MYRWIVKTKKFSTDADDDLAEYDAILNNPLCTILAKKDDKLRHEEFDEGKIISSEETIIFIVTWKEKVLL